MPNGFVFFAPGIGIRTLGPASSPSAPRAEGDDEVAATRGDDPRIVSDGDLPADRETR